MARLSWMGSGTRFFEAGVGNGVLYIASQPGVAWTGLTAVDERPSGGDPTPYYLDGVKYLQVSAAEEYEATISAYTYPMEFGPCDGTAREHSGLFVTAQPRKPFSFSYQTRVGNDIEKVDHAYKIHIVYNALASPSSRSFKTLGADVNTADFTWDITTKPPKMAGYKNSAHLIVDSRYANPATMSAIEDILYGSASTSPRLPDLAELIEVFNTYATFSVTDHGDGSFSVSGPDSMVYMTGADTYEFVSDSVIPLDSDSYSVSSI